MTDRIILRYDCERVVTRLQLQDLGRRGQEVEAPQEWGPDNQSVVVRAGQWWEEHNLRTEQECLEQEPRQTVGFRY